ncbi:hypothetical protein ASPZODRAFT_126985 [Penicilliopsis zonata CBS 506.65]|uniref:Integral membrane protein TmpA n=1 Tax=Penicilliopsis zonata CBS 506.65 TaxID=1073090 RepID=A0A1L9SUX4_9EURO|nr:hypothetical protein ASPZODRAFT_126985 [Penicilliopsis zonata CBS 506.65]OJJ50998.1 hypothetical protein ASPZODRAFT_126985 [Penicilliopsis zonata CBS 506.65]
MARPPSHRPHLSEATTIVESPEEAKIDELSEGSDVEAQISRKPFAHTRYALLTVYRRLFGLVFLSNLGVFIYVLATRHQNELIACVNAAAANLLVCGLARHPHVVNAVYSVLSAVPRRAPLRLRHLVAKTYHYGGVHSGCGVASFLWYVGFTAILTTQYLQNTLAVSVAVVVVTYLILVALLAIILAAYPGLRSKRHNVFEFTHRFLGWTVVALFVVLLLLFAHEYTGSSSSDSGKNEGEGKNEGKNHMGDFLLHLPAFWFLILAVLAIVHPWLLLRKVQVRAEYLSQHAVRLHFNHTSTGFAKGISVSNHPLRDWHAFATFPDLDDQPEGDDDEEEEEDKNKKFSCLVSRAGDWTTSTIGTPPRTLWKRGTMLYGFAHLMKMYERVLLITTGSGIGPCLAFLGASERERPLLRVVWQTRAPLVTYGPKILDLVHRLDSNPVIIDSDRKGKRVDVLPLARKLISQFDADAVCVISNPRLTRKIVFELEATGVAAYGPIFDS